ncbi:MAG: hypothetical protein GW892_29280 [Armatimonadetes bacterium]|nr:hypothetical protein [Armatimonadota bacterium]
MAAMAAVLPTATGCVNAGEEPPATQSAAPYAAWQNGPGSGADYFPIAVWLQSPANAPKYKEIGINLFVGLWEGPTEKQLAELRKHGMPVICDQNGWALQHLDEKTIVGWMHGDEPDNAQSLGAGKGYGPPVAPTKIVEDYQRIKTNDPRRPVMLNLGQGVAWDGWYGRGVRTNHPEDYAEYVPGCDIASFDIYPAVHDRPEVAGKLWYVPRGVSRLRQWTAGRQLVWNCVECTRISNANVKPTPAQVKAEVWMALIHGSQGLIYFAHQFKPSFVEAGLLADPEMSQAVGRLNSQIHELAPVLNSPTVEGAVTVEATPAEVDPERAKLLPGEPLATMVKRHGGSTYVFAAQMENTPASASFSVAGVPGKTTAEVLGEGRSLAVQDGEFADTFESYGVHLYRIR